MPDFAADGTVIHSVDMNKIMKVIGVVAVAGSPPTTGASSGYTMQVGTNVSTTDANGEITVTYPAAFATGIVGALACWGDEISGGKLLEVANNTSKTTLKVRVVNSSGTPQTSFGPVRISWIAVGWS